jgi:nitroreductase
MQMNFLELTKSRHSVREYSPKEVEQDKIDYIIECARLAPSAVNKQPWGFIVVKSEKGKEDLRKCYSREWFGQAPLYIIIYVDKDAAWVRASDNKNHCDIDASIAIEHICLAAAELGLGTCWVCNFDVEQCIKIFDIGTSSHPVALIPIGYPNEKVIPKRTRKEVEELVRVV